MFEHLAERATEPQYARDAVIQKDDWNVFWGLFLTTFFTLARDDAGADIVSKLYAGNDVRGSLHELERHLASGNDARLARIMDSVVIPLLHSCAAALLHPEVKANAASAWVYLTPSCTSAKPKSATVDPVEKHDSYVG